MRLFGCLRFGGVVTHSPRKTCFRLLVQLYGRDWLPAGFHLKGFKLRLSSSPELLARCRFIFAGKNDELIPSPGNVVHLFHGLCRVGKIDWASESHQELDRCLSRTITASKNCND